MNRLIIIIVLVSFISCQNLNRPQVFGLYYDISEYRHVCGWCIGKDYMYLNYILSSQQTEYIYIIN